MNFKLIFILLLISACGVKGDPASPKSPPLPSFLDNYPDIELEQPINEFQKK